MEFNEIGFAEWCLCNTKYSFDADGKIDAVLTTEFVIAGLKKNIK